VRGLVNVLAIALAAGVGLASCGHDAAHGAPPDRGSDAAEDVAREQLRFDTERRPDLVVKALAIKPGSRVADVGAGSGLLTVHLARAVAPTGKVTATDVAAHVLDLMKQRLVEGRIVAADTPGLEDGAYDAILLAEVDNYFTDPVAWLRAALPALKPGGRIVIENRIHHRAKSMAAAQKAGLVLLEESNPVPTHFLAVFVAPGGAPGSDADKLKPTP
jgi:2-polyprenyl-3-methyl-5-hydroxy-6-metoxy-1,4-benzoquinol methylase